MKNTLHYMYLYLHFLIPYTAEPLWAICVPHLCSTPAVLLTFHLLSGS